MSAIDEVVKANNEYAKKFGLAELQMPPARKLAIIACMDARMILSQLLGLKAGDAHMIRNAGGIVTDDVLRTLILSHHLQGTQEFMIINHTECGMLTFKDEELLARLERETGTAAEAPARFYAFADLESNVREQIQKIKSHPWIPDHVSVRGFVYDVKTGKLNEVSAPAGTKLKAVG